MSYSALDPEADLPAVVLSPVPVPLRPGDRLREMEIDRQIRDLVAERARLRRRINRHPREWALRCLQAACEVCYATEHEVHFGKTHADRVVQARHMWIALLAKVTGCSDYSIEKLTGRNAGANRNSRLRCQDLISTSPDFRRRWKAACEIVGIKP